MNFDGSRRVLALDLGKETGWAWTDDHEAHVEQSGTWNLHSAMDSKDDPHARVSRLITWITKINPDDIVYERVTQKHLGTKAAEWYGRYSEAIETLCDERHIACFSFSVEEIKEHAIGNRKGAKMHSHYAAIKKWGDRVQVDHQSDALWILDLYKRTQRSVDAEQDEKRRDRATEPG